jgi:hypothetical protein
LAFSATVFIVIFWSCALQNPKVEKNSLVGTATPQALLSAESMGMPPEMERLVEGSHGCAESLGLELSNHNSKHDFVTIVPVYIS